MGAGDVQLSPFAQDPCAAAAIAPLHVTVAIISYRRPRGLARLLAALSRQKVSVERPFVLRALVVDNDVGETAQQVVAQARATTSLAVDYVAEPRQGIPIARNRALAELNSDADIVAFIDDDEWPCDQWLDEMLRMRAETGAQCIWGPVTPAFPPDAPNFFKRCGIFDRLDLPDGAQLPFAASNNVIVDRRFIAKNALKFDERLRFSGGSDLRFFTVAMREGMRVCWSNGAVVFEEIPHFRMTWAWMLQRQYRIGNTFAMCDKLDGGGMRSLCRFGSGVFKVGLGLLTSMFYVFAERKRMRAVVDMVRGVGMIGGVFGLMVNEYAPDKLAARECALFDVAPTELGRIGDAQ